MKHMNQTSIHSGRTGFTLIEMLVVIAILALLMGLLVPGLSRARRKASRTACLARLKDLGNAVMIYAADHKGKTLPYYTHNSQWYNTFRLESGGPGLLITEGYLPFSENAFRCPSDRGAGRGGRYNYEQVPAAPDISYSFRPWGPYSAGNNTPSDGAITSIGNGPANDSWRASSYAYISDAFCRLGALPRNHSDGWNVWYLDGHAKFIKDPPGGSPIPDNIQVYGTGWPQGYQPWRYFETGVYPD